MRRLKGAYPRAFGDHRSGLGRRYGGFCRRVAARFGGAIPDEAKPLVKALGRLDIDVDRVNAELEQALARRRMRDARRYRRQLAGMNRDVLTFTARLDDLVKAQPVDYAAMLRRAGR